MPPPARYEGLRRKQENREVIFLKTKKSCVNDAFPAAGKDVKDDNNNALS